MFPTAPTRSHTYAWYTCEAVCIETPIHAHTHSCKRVPAGSHTTNAKHVKTLSTFVGGYTWQYAYGHWVECDARTPENRRLREDRESAERRGRRGERRAEEEGLCRADHSVQSSMGAFGFYPLIVLDDDVQVSAFMRCG